MARTRTVSVVAGLLLVFAVGTCLTLWVIHGGDPAARRRIEIKRQFVGSATCAECHSAIANSFRSTGMGCSMQQVDASSPLENDTEKNSFSPDGRHHYSIERTSEGVFHHERLINGDGQTVYDQALKIDYALGSGTQGKSFLINRDGLMFHSPIDWYGRAGKWDLAPGYTLPNHPRFERMASAECLTCHSGQMNQVPGLDNHFEQPPFQELSIGCERCHGPGAEHVRFRRGHAKGESPDPIVNPARLDPARRDDVCSQCHLTGEARYLREGCQFGDFRPGQRLEDVYLVLVHGTGATADGRTRAVSQVEQMRSSACYVKSGGRMGCTSCHDPHSQHDLANQAEFYQGKCLGCHTEQGCSLPETQRLQKQADDSCIACHMPRLNASDVPHATQTDHRILSQPNQFVPDNNPAQDLLELFDGAEQRLPSIVVERARAIWMADHAASHSDRAQAARALRLLQKVSRQLPKDADVLDALGNASAIEGRMEPALKYWKEALSIDPNRELTLSTTATVLVNLGRFQAARPILEKQLQIQPWNAAMWGRYSIVLGQLGESDKAIEAGRKAIEIDPSNPKTYLWLAELYGRIGDDEQRKRYTDLHLRVLPGRSSLQGKK